MTNSEKKQEIININLDDIIPNRFQPREIFDERALKELALSIKEHGVIQPIIVRKVNEKYEIIAGERRYKASAIAGLTKIPAIVRELDDKESSKVALLENLQRKNLNPIEEARTYQKILELDEMTQEELAKTMGKSQSSVANKLRLLSLDDEVQDALLKEKISERHARTIASIKDEEKQKELLRNVIDNKMNVRQLEEEINRMNQDKSEDDIIPKDINEQTIDANNFINTPLIPTSQMPDIDNHYGEVKIVPPIEEQSGTGDNKMQSEPIIPIINIENKEELDNDDKDSEKNALDGLLSNDNIEENRKENRFIHTDVEDKDDQSNNLNFQLEKEKNDYFGGNNKDDISSSNEEQINEVSLSSIIEQNLQKEEENKVYTIESSIEKIKKLVEELQNNNIKATIDEMNFKKSYQIIIKLDKEEE